jgi:hypothetical protein
VEIYTQYQRIFTYGGLSVEGPSWLEPFQVKRDGQLNFDAKSKSRKSVSL